MDIDARGRVIGQDANRRREAVWIGVTILRTIMAVGPMCDQKCEIVSTKLAIAVRSGDVGGLTLAAAVCEISSETEHVHVGAPECPALAQT